MGLRTHSQRSFSMTDLAVHQRAMRLLVRQGHYADAALYAAALPPALRAHPVITLEAARAQMRQGRMRDAEALLQAADLTTGTSGLQLIVRLERAAVTIYRGAPIPAALAAASQALTAADTLPIDPVERAEAERVQVRMLLQAMTYRELPAADGLHALERLPGLAAVLEGGGRVDEALAARLTYAEQLPDLAARLPLLAELAELAVHLDRPEVAGETLVASADLLLKTGAARAAIEADLDRAAGHFAQIAHAHGPIDVACVRARLNLARELGSASPLEACLQSYLALAYPRGALSVLLDLSHLAHQRGDTLTAAAYRRQGSELAEGVGMELARESFVLAQADLLMRAADFRGAIELCQAARRTARSSFFAASYEQLLSSAYGLAGDVELAVLHGRAALAAYAELGDEDSASDAVLKLASDLGSLRKDTASAEAEQLLQDWLPRDHRRGDADAAAAKYELLAQTLINQFIYGPSRRRDPSLLPAVADALAAGEALAAQLPPQQSALRSGSLAQMRGQLAQLRDDARGVEQAWLAALAHYERADLTLYAANCRYILGALALNRANQELLPAFGEAETYLAAALGFYHQSGMRTQAADTRFMFARLYTNAAAQQPQLADELLAAALGHLEDGEQDYDAIRRDYAAGSVLDDQRGKQALAGRSQRLYALILEILVHRGDAAQVWRWSQRAKARALGDTLGTSTAVPARMLSAVQTRPELQALLDDERDLIRRLEATQAEGRPALRASLEAVRASMAQAPELADYLELRSGAAVEASDLEALLDLRPGQAPGVVCLDWVAVDERLLLVSWRPGSPPVVTRLPLRVPEVRQFVTEHLSALTFRATLRDMPELLRALDPLIAPLATLCEPEDLLVLAPTGPLHALPLHALHLGDAPLLVRNPVVYTPSLSVLRHCLARAVPAAGRPSVALLGDPSDDRPSATALVERLAGELGAMPLVGRQVTRAAFTAAVSNADLIHFQGHAVHMPADPLGSYLQLADGPLTARDLFAIRELRPALVTLAACESAASVIGTGDEPLGLIPALLFAGANAVVATLWRVQASATAEVMAGFYAALLRQARPTDRARALRAAMLEQRARPDRDAPYYWAPFALYGDWQSGGGAND